MCRKFVKCGILKMYFKERKNKKDSNQIQVFFMQQACLSAISDKSLFELTL